MNIIKFAYQAYVGFSTRGELEENLWTNWVEKDSPVL